MTSQNNDDQSLRDPNDTKWVDYHMYSKPDGTFKVEEEAIDKGLYKKNAVYITDDMGWFHEISEEKFKAALDELEEQD